MKQYLILQENTRNCRSFENSDLIHDLVVGVLDQDYVDSLDDSLKVVKNEFAEGTFCGRLIEECYTLRNLICLNLNIDIEDDNISFIFDAFYKSLECAVKINYEAALRNMELNSLLNFEERIVQVQRLQEKIIMASHEIKKSLDNKFEIIMDSLLTNFGMLTTVVEQKATKYGNYYYHYLKNQSYQIPFLKY